MVTTDKITVNKGDKVWRIDYGEVTEGVVYQSDDRWTTVQWLYQSDYHASFEPYGHGDDKDGNPTFEVDYELFGSEVNAINALINRTIEGINKAQLLIEKLQDRVSEIEQ